MKNFLLWILTALLVLLTIMSAVHAAGAYSYYSQVNPNYIYYEGHDSLPIVAGPYPRYYLGFSDQVGTDAAGNGFLHDDFDNYDSYEGYRDLDVYYPDRGYVDVLRNPSGNINQMDVPDRVARSADEYHVQGYLPNGGTYVKHYYHDHEWDLGNSQYDGYGYGYGTSFEPLVYNRARPVFTNNCFSAVC
jgi:hypothetical protein